MVHLLFLFITLGLELSDTSLRALNTSPPRSSGALAGSLLVRSLVLSHNLSLALSHPLARSLSHPLALSPTRSLTCALSLPHKKKSFSPA